MPTPDRKMFQVEWSWCEQFCSFQILAHTEQEAREAFDRACAYHAAQGKGNDPKYPDKDVTVSCWQDTPHMHRFWKGTGHFVFSGPYRFDL